MGDVEVLVDEAFTGPLAPSFAVLVVQSGEVVVERYGELWGEAITAATTLRSWSMAKSMLHAAVGILVGDGRLAVEDPAPVPAWAGDERAAITIDQLLAMRDGLAFREEYVLGEVSDTIEMLFGAGREDVAAYATARPLAAPPGSRFNYSSGTTNVLSSIVASIVGPGDAYRRFLRERLFEPAGMVSAEPGLDAAGTWVASSYVDATARDFARFGELYLGGGAGVVPDGWVEHGTRHRSVDEDSGSGYGAHWWLPSEHEGFECRGYQGQSITVVPAADLVVVRLGDTPAERAPELRAWRGAMVEAMRR